MEYRRNPIWLFIVICVFIAVILGIITWGNYQYTKQNPGGIDFLSNWVGVKILLTEGINPYGDEATDRIQLLAYWRPVKLEEPRLRMTVPLYSIVIYLPYALIPDYQLARALWMTTLEAALVLLSILCIHLTNWKPNRLELFMFILFSIFGYHSFWPLLNGNIVILVTLFMTGGILALRANADELAGVLFAYTTMMPQVFLIILIFIVYWAILKRRWRMIGWLLATIILLSVSVALLMPDWILQYLRAVIGYPLYSLPGTPEAVFSIWFPEFGKRVGRAISCFLAMIMLFEWRLIRNTTFRGFVWTVCLTLIMSQLVGIKTNPGNFVIMLPAMVLLFALWEERWHRAGRVLSLVSIFLLLVGLWVLFIYGCGNDARFSHTMAMFFPLPIFLLISLYWVRWWVMEPSSEWFGITSNNGFK